MTGPAPLRLAMTRIGKAFGGVPVLKDVHFAMHPGEVVALLGSNGAGKSTLMKILSGVYSLDSGQVEIDGRPVHFATPSAAIAAGVRLLPQEISIIPDMTVAENILIGDLPTRGAANLLDRGAMRATARRLMERLGFADIVPDRRVGTLSPARQRIVEVARAIQGGASILVMDEPTAALSAKEADVLFGIIRQLKREQVSVVYISHHMSEVFEIADRIVVLRDGNNAGEYRPGEATPDAVLASMLGQAVKDLYDGPHGEPGRVLLSVAGLTIPGHLADIDLELRAGEIVGVFGLVGSGIESLGHTLFSGRPQASAGEMRVDGAVYRDPTAAASVARGIGFIASERKKEGIVGELTVRENLSLPFLRHFTKGGVVSRGAEGRLARDWIGRLDIRTRGPEQKIRTLSGGNQQKVCIARWLTENVRLLILEEPTRGVDVGARRDIYRELHRLAAEGYGILIISSDVDEVAGMADRSIILDRGRISARLPRGTPAERLLAAAGGAAHLAEARA